MASKTEGTVDTWTAVDDFVASLEPADAVLDAARARAREAGLPDIAVSPAQGRWLFCTARAMGARSILEIGTLGGYSTIWLARALPAGGRLVTLEINPTHAAVASTNLDAAGLADRVDIRVGPAASTLRALAGSGGWSFDLAFIDADKTGYPEYFRLVLPLVRRGGLIIADNVVRGGEVADAASTDANVTAVREYLRLVAREPRVTGTVLQTVGSKGYDGFSIAILEHM